MKKTIIILLCVASGALLGAAIKQQKTYTVSGTLQDHQAVLAVIEQSNAPHSTVEAVKKWYVDQIQAQLTAEGKTALKADSLKKDGVRQDSIKNKAKK